jgi:phenylacetate-CoA oxygenase PaaJ subunit
VTAALEKRVWEALSRISDPEMPVSLVDMGMVYRVAVADGTAEIDLTFTSIGCPAMDMILGDVREAVTALPGIDRVEIEVVWSPPWTKDRLTTKGRTLLSAFGLAL